uniref:Cellular communication network factor 5 n=1 Tax=Ornithorhynchus anatinus TaxID=9258 RepID=A0A6I8P459_ORNAN
MRIQLLTFPVLCILSKACAQFCRRPCHCPWRPPRCPPGAPLVLDGCQCCRVCARRLGEPCDPVNVCDQSQGLVCDHSAALAGGGATCNFDGDEAEDADGGCEMNGRIYRAGEVFQPSCKLQCRCSEGGFTCVPLCSEDVRLPSWDCPHPRRVAVPGKCCQEWVCDQTGGEMVPPAAAGTGGWPPRGPALPQLPGPHCKEWGTAWGPCSASCGLGVATRLTNQNRDCRLEPQHRLCLLRPCPSSLLPAASPRGDPF